MPENTTTPPSNSPFNEAFFNEIENRAYRGARRALFHQMIMSIVGFFVIWLVVAALVYMIVLPRLTQMMEQQFEQLNPLNQLRENNNGGIFDQFRQLQQYSQ